MRDRLSAFRREVMLSKLRLHALIKDIKEKGGRIYGISAPSRASTLINYVGLDEAIIDYVCEIDGSLKIGKCVPGTLIPVVEESRLFADQQHQEKGQQSRDDREIEHAAKFKMQPVKQQQRYEGSEKGPGIVAEAFEPERTAPVLLIHRRGHQRQP